MASPIEKAKQLIAKGEKARHGPWDASDNETDRGYTACVAGADGDVFAQVGAILVDDNRAIDNATYIAAANPADLLPILRLLVECEHWIDGVCELIETSDFVPTGEPRLVEEAQRGRALVDKLRRQS